MLSVTHLAALVFLPVAICLNLNLTDSKAPLSNSAFNVTWTREPADPKDFTLVLLGPGMPVNATTHPVVVKGQNSGVQEMNVGVEGNYVVTAVDPDHGVVASIHFLVLPVISTTSVAEMSGSSTTRSTSTDSLTISNSSTSSSSFVSPPNASSLAMPTLISTQNSDMTSASAPSLSEPSSSSSRSNKVPTIVGSVIGSIAFIIIVIGIIILIRRRLKREDGPVTFYRDMMVRPPSFSQLDHAQWHAASSDEYDVTTMGGRASNPSLTRKKSNPFRDPDLMSRLSMHVDEATVVSPSPHPVLTPVRFGSPLVPL